MIHSNNSSTIPQTGIMKWTKLKASQKSFTTTNYFINNLST